MRTERHTGIALVKVKPRAPRPAPRSRKRWNLASRFFSGEGSNETVSTSMRFTATPEAVWDSMVSYEEVPVRPPLLLRALLPVPIRTEGDKTCAGANVQCVYEGGSLIKSITAVEPPHLLEFDVIEQALGVERCVEAIRGSYRITKVGERTEVVLSTLYRAYLRPRWLWRPMEQFLGHVFHRHILNGMRESL